MTRYGNCFRSSPPLVSRLQARRACVAAFLAGVALCGLVWLLCTLGAR